LPMRGQKDRCTMKKLMVMLAVLLVAATVQAATITQNGNDLNLGHTNADLRGSALGEADAIGTLFFNTVDGSGNKTPITTNIREKGIFDSSWLTFSAGAHAGHAGNWSNYAKNAKDDYSGGNFDIDTGMGFATNSNGALRHLGNLTVGAGFQADIRLGVVLDTADSSGLYAADDVKLTIGSNSASVTGLTTNNDSIDVYWFDITGLVQGDVIKVETANNRWEAGIGGFIVVPEPATMTLLGIGGLLALVRRRRK